MKMELVYASTRDAQERVTASQAILRGLANAEDCLYRHRFRRWMCRLEELGKMSYQRQHMK